jgi:hypothetical protein
MSTNEELKDVLVTTAVLALVLLALLAAGLPPLLQWFADLAAEADLWYAR